MLDSHGIECPINFQGHFDYIEALFYNRKKIDIGYKLSRRKHVKNVFPSLRRVNFILLSHMSTETDKII